MIITGCGLKGARLLLRQVAYNGPEPLSDINTPNYILRGKEGDVERFTVVLYYAQELVLCGSGLDTREHLDRSHRSQWRQIQFIVINADDEMGWKAYRQEWIIHDRNPQAD